MERTNSEKTEFEKRIERAIEEEIKARIEDEIKNAQERIEREIRESIGTIVISILKYYEIQMMHDKIVITVKDSRGM